MEPFTMDGNFQKQHIIDGFSSIIWTERYYGDGSVEMVVPWTMESIPKLLPGTFLGIDQSDEVMLLESLNIEGGKIKVVGKSLLPWLNNRFVRASAAHEDKVWNVTGVKAGYMLWFILNSMCGVGSAYLNGTIPTGIPDPEDLAISNLILRDYDTSGPDVSVSVPYGPLYDALKTIATTYEIGMQLLLESHTNLTYNLCFRSYKGLDRSSNQTDNSVVRFSSQMNTLTNIKELQSIAAFKTAAYAFAPSNPGGVASTPGVSKLSEYTDFDLRALLVFADDITEEMVGGNSATLIALLNTRASDAISANPFIKAVDGEIVPGDQLVYGNHYNMGDIIEIEGNSGIIQTARITEYIRAQDEVGERAYPTMMLID